MRIDRKLISFSEVWITAQGLGKTEINGLFEVEIPDVFKAYKQRLMFQEM